jgi:hypothetical protein
MTHNGDNPQLQPEYRDEIPQSRNRRIVSATAVFLGAVGGVYLCAKAGGEAVSAEHYAQAAGWFAGNLGCAGSLA